MEYYRRRWRALPPSERHTEAFGSPAKRLLSVFTPIIDTGTTGSGALKTNNGTTIFQWANTGTVGVGATPAATGKGVTFPASQSASSDANTLDDYAEGTWTPGVSFGGASVGVTYNTQTGRYTKMGRLVWVEFNVVLTSKGSSVGSAAVTGLPFAGGSDSPTGALIWTGWRRERSNNRFSFWEHFRLYGNDHHHRYWFFKYVRFTGNSCLRGISGQNGKRK
jgi:hypothetical protein